MKKTILATTLLAVLSTSAMASVIPGHTSDNVNRGHRHNEKAQNAWNVHTDGRISGNKAEADSNKDGIDWNSKRIADNNKFDDAQVNTNIKDRKAQEANAKGVAGNTAKEAAALYYARLKIPFLLKFMNSSSTSSSKQFCILAIIANRLLLNHITIWEF